MVMPFKWNQENQELLEKRWEENIRLDLIAAELGTTKGSIAGKARRLNLECRAIWAKGKTRKTRTVTQEYTKSRITVVQRQTGIIPLPVPVNSVLPSARVEHSIPVWRRTCQYISGKPTGSDACKCGDPVYGSSAYCSTHRLMVWKQKAKDG